MYRVKQFFKRIYNVYRWIPVLWRDRDWDHYYTYEILKTKLTFQSEYTRDYGYHVSSDHEANRMDLCIELIDRVQTEYYLNECIDKYGVDNDEETINALKKHDKARRLLFKLLEHNIERWWD